MVYERKGRNFISAEKSNQSCLHKRSRKRRNALPRKRKTNGRSSEKRKAEPKSFFERGNEKRVALPLVKKKKGARRRANKRASNERVRASEKKKETTKYELLPWRDFSGRLLEAETTWLNSTSKKQEGELILIVTSEKKRASFLQRKESAINTGKEKEGKLFQSRGKSWVDRP